MAPDYLFYWMTLPAGLLLIGVAAGLPFFLWRKLLQESFSQYGFTPLALAYFAAAVGLVVNNFAFSYLEFSSRVAKDMLQEAERWSTVPGWTIYTSVLALIIVLPLLGLVAVPASAYLLKLRKLNLFTISLGILTAWLMLCLFFWALPSNDWHKTHRLESLLMILKEFFFSFAVIGGSFLLSILYVCNKRHLKATDAA